MGELFTEGERRQLQTITEWSPQFKNEHGEIDKAIEKIEAVKKAYHKFWTEFARASKSIEVKGHSFVGDTDPLDAIRYIQREGRIGSPGASRGWKGMDYVFSRALGMLEDALEDLEKQAEDEKEYIKKLKSGEIDV